MSSVGERERKESNMSGKNSGFGDFVTGFLMGALVGGAIAILKAPQSGEETRAQLRTKSAELRDTAEQRMDEALTTVRSAAQDVSHRTEELRVQSQTVMDETQKQWAKATEEIKSTALEAIEEMRATAAEAVAETEKAGTEAT
jgi:gas vesicle protein